MSCFDITMNNILNGERERDRQTDRHRQTDRDRQRQTETEGQTDRKKDAQIQYDFSQLTRKIRALLKKYNR